jgi:hypothetical protein
LICDNDTKFTTAFETVFRSEGIDVIRTPYQAPMPIHLPNVGSNRAGGVSEQAVEPKVVLAHHQLGTFATGDARVCGLPQLGPSAPIIAQQIPALLTAPIGSVPVRCRPVLGGLIHAYYRDAA